MLKKRIIKQKKLAIDGMEFIYSVSEYSDEIILRVYKKASKIVWLTIRFSFTEAWGIYLYRPKTVAYLIELCQQKYECDFGLELMVCESSQLIPDVLQYYYTGLVFRIEEWMDSLSHSNSIDVKIEKTLDNSYILKCKEVKKRATIKLTCPQKEYEPAIFFELKNSENTLLEACSYSAILSDQELNQKLTEFLTKLGER